jgi:hypothetical protein
MLTDIQDLLYEPQQLYALRIASGFAVAIILLVMGICTFLLCVDASVFFACLFSAPLLHAALVVGADVVGMMRRRRQRLE